MLPFVAAAAIGAGIGAEVDKVAYFLGRYLGLRAFGVLYGFLFGAYLLGGGIGPPLMGYGYVRSEIAIQQVTSPDPASQQ